MHHLHPQHQIKSRSLNKNKIIYSDSDSDSDSEKTQTFGAVTRSQAVYVSLHQVAATRSDGYGNGDGPRQRGIDVTVILGEMYPCEALSAVFGCDPPLSDQVHEVCVCVCVCVCTNVPVRGYECCVWL